MPRDPLPLEAAAAAIDASPYPEDRNLFGMCDLSVCGPILMSEAELAFLLQAIPERGRYCEIGSWCAAGLGWIADRRPDVHCLGVDCFEGPSHRRMFAALANWDQRPNLDLYFGRIENLAWQDNCFDAVLVDGDHTGDAVYRDLSIAAEMVKSSGVLLAHDYGTTHAEVQPAVDQFCIEHSWAITARVESLVKLQWYPL